MLTDDHRFLEERDVLVGRLEEGRSEIGVRSVWFVYYSHFRYCVKLS